MESYFVNDLEIIFDFAGRNDWKKFSFPIWYGIPVKIKWRGYEFDFNLRGNLKRIKGNLSVWPNPLELLKRNDSNDYIYYGSFGYEFSYDLIKNYYVPYTGIYECAVFKERPLENSHVKKALMEFDKLVIRSGELSSAVKDERPKKFLAKVAARGREALAREATALHNIIGGSLPVLPPDTIDVDYEVIPLMVVDGCGWNCDFCRFKTKGSFKVRSQQEIERQVYALRDLYREDLINYNSLVLGQNNALAAGETILIKTIQIADKVLKLHGSYFRGDPNIFFFASAKSLLKVKERFFETLNSLPYNFYINVGLESPDQQTLDKLGKPLTAYEVKESFKKAQYVNDNYARIDITSNFILGRDLSRKHLEMLKDLLCENGSRKGKGTVYLSPLIDLSDKRQVLKNFKEVKRISPLPVYIYLMQRL